MEESLANGDGWDILNDNELTYVVRSFDESMLLTCKQFGNESLGKGWV
jgi:hypothetical protein